MIAALVKARRNRSDIRLSEDSRLYDRLHKQSLKQDRRISQLEKDYANAMDKYANCMQEHGEATARIEYLEQQNDETKSRHEEMKEKYQTLKEEHETLRKRFNHNS